MKYEIPLEEFIFNPHLFLSADQLFINKFQTSTNIKYYLVCFYGQF